jgi:hypothetical protein
MYVERWCKKYDWDYFQIPIITATISSVFGQQLAVDTPGIGRIVVV